MFLIGDRIVHPLHGAGVIEDIVERTIDGAPAQYYAVRPAFGDTQLFIPVDGCARLGIRPVCSREDAEALIRSGDLYEVALVIKSLSARDRERGLSNGEKKMLSSARQIIVSELAFALDRAPEEVDALIIHKLCE